MRAWTPVVLVLLSAAPAAAQQSTPPAHTWWASLGGGFGQMEEAGDFGGHVAVSFQSGARVLSIRAAAVTSLLENLFGASGHPDEVADIGLLYGRGSTRGPVQASAGIGVGLAEVMILGPGSIRRGTWYFTVPLELQVAWRPLRFLGVGAYGFASFNGGQSFGGLTFMLQAGRLR